MDRGYYNLLKWVAILFAVFFVATLVYQYYDDLKPSDQYYIAGNKLFKDGYYTQAEQQYLFSLNEEPNHVPSLRAIGNSYVMQKKFDMAYKAFDRAIELEPNFGGSYALKGIAKDHEGKYQEAIILYEKALTLDDELNESMGIVDRLLYNVHEEPPSVADRYKYLKEQMSLPEDQRKLYDKEIDDKQRPYQK